LRRRRFARSAAARRSAFSSLGGDFSVMSGAIHGETVFSCRIA
jgi:hypothetical protein